MGHPMDGWVLCVCHPPAAFGFYRKQYQVETGYDIGEGHWRKTDVQE